MKKLLFLIMIFISTPTFASWVNWFRISDQQYKVYVISNNQLNITAGFYLTNFPCYGAYNQEYYRTIVGKNMITLYCLEPPKTIYLTYITKPLGSFFPRNEKATGYMICPVDVTTNLSGGVIPRMQVNIENCEKREINPKANRDIIEQYGGVEL